MNIANNNFMLLMHLMFEVMNTNLYNLNILQIKYNFKG